MKWSPQLTVRTVLTLVPAPMKVQWFQQGAADLSPCQRRRWASRCISTPRAACFTLWSWSTTGCSSVGGWLERNMRYLRPVSSVGTPLVVEGAGAPQVTLLDPGLDRRARQHVRWTLAAKHLAMQTCEPSCGKKMAGINFLCKSITGECQT